MASDARKKELRIVYSATLGEPWDTVTRRLQREWEQAVMGLVHVDAANTAAVLRLQERAKSIDALLGDIRRDVTQVERGAADD